MSRRPRRNHSAAFKAKVAIEALAEGKTIAEIAHKHDVHPNQVAYSQRSSSTTIDARGCCTSDLRPPRFPNCLSLLAVHPSENISSFELPSNESLVDCLPSSVPSRRGVRPTEDCMVRRYAQGQVRMRGAIHELGKPEDAIGKCHRL